MSLRVFLLYVLTIPLFYFGASPFYVARASSVSIQNADYLQYLTEIKNHGVALGSDTHFTITNSDYLNITLNSTEQVSLRIESIPKTVNITVEASTGALSTDFTLTGFLPNTNYFKYEDDYHDLVQFTTDPNGSYTYTQDISTKHQIFILTKRSTKFLRDDTTGGDCATIGVWDTGTKTCTLTTDLTETIEVDADNIILDGANRVLTGSDTGTGVFLLARSGVTVKNLNIQNFTYGIFLISSLNNQILDNVFTNTIQGITLDSSNNNRIEDNAVLVDTLSPFRYQGIIFFTSSENSITGDTITMNANLVSPSSRQGVLLFDSNDNIFTGMQVVKNGQAVLYFNSARNIFQRGTIDQSGSDAFLLFSSPDSQVYNNNFTNNTSYLKNFSTNGTFDMPIPNGGNYWDTFDTPAEGCEDANADHVCDAPFVFTGGTDTKPWNIPNGWPNTDPVPLPAHDPVILIPGIIGSYLNKNYGDFGEIWPNAIQLGLSFSDAFLNDLALNTDGTENSLFPITVGDIIREEAGSHVFDGLIGDLESAGYVEGTDLFVFPYDWRKSNTDNAVLLKDKIDEVLGSTNSGKVDIVAHSMGGIIVKTYISNEGKNKINQLVFLGTPHLGAPKAFKALMYGDDMDFKKLGVSIFSKERMKVISQNMPAVFELLPSEKYITKIGGYVTNAINNPSTILNYNQTKDFMLAKGKNALMFPFAESLHDSIDDLDLFGIETSNFVGCGTKTIGGISIKQKLGWISSGFKMVEDYDLKYVNGDQTVPLISADDIPSANVYYAKKITHGSLPSGDGVKEDVVAILTGNSLPDSPNILTDTTTCNISGKTVSTHSPVELHIYDEFGNHTGPNANGDIENNIDGVEYDQLEGDNFAFLPDGINYKIVTKATDTGGYDLKIKAQDENDNITAENNWVLIPLPTPQASGEIMVGPSYPPSSYVVKMDNDGNGTVDKTVLSNQPLGFKFYLNILREVINSLDLKAKTKKEILEKIDKIEKKLEKGKIDKIAEKLAKFLQKLNSSKGKLKNIPQADKDAIINSISSLLNEL